jgi:4-hydroxybenzoate polyprenyltransferase
MSSSCGRPSSFKLLSNHRFRASRQGLGSLHETCDLIRGDGRQGSAILTGLHNPAGAGDVRTQQGRETPLSVGTSEVTAGVGASTSTPPSAWVRLLRPKQWIKNAFVLAPLIFSGRAFDWSAQWQALATFVAFCLAASGVYAMNDVVDREQDRAHPIKRARPVAAGLIAVPSALTASLLLIAAGVAVAFAVGVRVGVAVASYFFLNLAYAFVLKRMVILDVFAVASFFVLRLLAGAAAVDVRPSVWLLLCGGLLALYLGFAKRRQELDLLGGNSTNHRAVLSNYSIPFLDQLSLVLLAVTIVAYIMYTLESETAKAVGSEALSYSTVFVLYGVLRYLYLVHRSEGGNPAETLLTDRSLLIAVIAWVAYCGIVIYRPF